MLFNSQVFIVFFLPAVLWLYYALAANRTARQASWCLPHSASTPGGTSASCRCWWTLTLANWLIAYWFGASGRRWIPLVGVVLNLAVAGAVQIRRLPARHRLRRWSDEPWQPWDLILPLGISFFVFQKISYLIDLRRGDRHIYGFLDFCMFVMFFPQLIAGPLVRHNEIIHQFAADPRRPEMWENLSRGFMLFLIGVDQEGRCSPTRWRWSPIRCSIRRCGPADRGARPGSPPPPTRCRSISISPAIPTWRSGSR